MFITSPMDAFQAKLGIALTSGFFLAVAAVLPGTLQRLYRSKGLIPRHSWLLIIGYSVWALFYVVGLSVVPELNFMSGIYPTVPQGVDMLVVEAVAQKTSAATLSAVIVAVPIFIWSLVVYLRRGTQSTYT